MMTFPYRSRARSKFLPSPQPSAVTRSESSLFSSTFASDALSVLSTFPRSGRFACRVSLDHEELAAVACRIRAVTQLAGQIEPRRGGALPGDFCLRGAARL